jgi:hypothetical protein
MTDGPRSSRGGDEWIGATEADTDEPGSSPAAESDQDGPLTEIPGATTDADRAEALAQATVARAEAARRATAARAEALRRISDQHVEAVRVAESDRDAAVERAQERYEHELRVAEEQARDAIGSACQESTTALEAAYAALVRAGETATTTAGSRDAAVDEAESVRSDAHGRASDERRRSVVAAYVAHSEALELAEGARSHELERMRPVEEELPGDIDS